MKESLGWTCEEEFLRNQGQAMALQGKESNLRPRGVEWNGMFDERVWWCQGTEKEERTTGGSQRGQLSLNRWQWPCQSALSLHGSVDLSNLRAEALSSICLSYGRRGAERGPDCQHPFPGSHEQRKEV